MTKEADEMLALLPCPFCGSDQQAINRNTYDGLLRVQCEGCWATSVTSNQRATVIAAWNTRAAARPPAVDREALADALRQIANGRDENGELLERGQMESIADEALATYDALLRPAAGEAGDREKLTHLIGMVRSLLRHTNPCSVNEGHSQQWFAVNDECDRLDLLRPAAREAVAMKAWADHHGWSDVPGFNPAPTSDQTGRDPATIDAVAAAINFEMAALERDARVSELTSAEIYGIARVIVGLLLHYSRRL